MDDPGDFMYTITSSDAPPPQMLDAFHVSEKTGEMCHMAGFPVVSPLTDSNFYPQRRFDKGFVTYNDRDDSQPKELVFYTVDPNSAKLTESQRLNVSALNGDLQAYTRDLRFFYTVSDDVITPGGCGDIKQNLRSYERTPSGFVERGVIFMGEASDCVTSNGASIMGLAANESWMLVSRFSGGPTGDSDGFQYYAFPIDAVTGAAIAKDAFTGDSTFNFESDTFSMRPDSRTLIELAGTDDDVAQFLHSWQVTPDGQVSESPGSPVRLDMDKPATALMPSGPTNYVVGIGDMLSEWSVAPDGSLKRLGEAASPFGHDLTAAGRFTDPGGIFMKFDFNRVKSHIDVVPYLHSRPAQLDQTPFEYVLPGSTNFFYQPK